MRPHNVVFTVAMMVAAGSLEAQTTTRPEVSRSAPIATQEVSNTQELDIPEGVRNLGTVRIPIRVLANGEPLAPGRYRVRLTGKTADSAPVGQLAALERWVEFLQGNVVKGRAMVPVVPQPAVAQVTDRRPPASGRFRVERLKQDEYLRLWYNLSGDQILIYLPIAPASAAGQGR